MNANSVRLILERAGCIRKGHFVLSSGKHSDGFVNKSEVFMYPMSTFKLAGEVVSRLQASQSEMFDLIAGAPMGALKFASAIALQYQARVNEVVLDIFPEKKGDDFVFGRGFAKHIPGKKALVVEDILTSGTSAKKIVATVRSLGGTVDTVVALVNRNSVTAEDLQISHLITLLDYPVPSWDEAECKLCQSGVPVDTEVGHGASFMALRNA